MSNSSQLIDRAVKRGANVLGKILPRPDRISDEMEVYYALSGPGPAEIPEHLHTEVPQAQTWERGMEVFHERDWRGYFSRKLSGRGIEFGALHRPMVKHDEMDVVYVDRFPVSVLREHYPELRDFPLVEAEILDDAATLETVEDNQFDFVISAHVIEHMPNPLLALRNWVRVLRPGGYLYLVVPDKRATFDKLRLRTTLEHIILDYLSPSAERDFGHFLESAMWSDEARGMEAIIQAKQRHAADYSIHFHVFLPSDIVELLRWFSENVAPIEIEEGPCQSPRSDEFHLLVKKPG